MDPNAPDEKWYGQMDITIEVARTHICNVMDQLGDQLPPLDALRLISDARFELELLEEHHVDRARAHGASWGDVARTIGYTRQGAWKKHAPREP